MNNKFLINTNDIEIKNNKIYFENTGFSSRINFASCWHEYSPEDFVRNKQKNFVGYNIPYINYIREENGFHFTIDMFNNDFVLKNECKNYNYAIISDCDY